MPKSTAIRVILFFASAGSGLLYALLGPDPVITGGGEMFAIGRNLARHGSFSDPFAGTINTGPTAVAAPLYPLLIGGLFKAFDAGTAWIILAVLAVAVLGIHACLLPDASRLLFGYETPGLIAAALCIAMPVLPWIPYWDAAYAAAAGLLFCIFSQRVLRKHGAISAGLLIGSFAGLLLLLSASLLFLISMWMPFLLVSNPRSWPFASVVCTTAFAAMLVIISPWVFRNYLVLGVPTLKDNFGMTFFASNNSCAATTLAESLTTGCYGEYHPSKSVSEAKLVIGMGEAHYDAYRMSSALVWIQAHRAAFASLTARRILEFWFPGSVFGFYAYVIWMITSISIAGFAWMIFAHRAAAIFVSGIFLVYPLMYYVIVSDPRYRYPIIWLSLLPAGLAIERMANVFRRFKRQAVKAHRIG